jgi:GNAT superfamily N-acetyltransferase
VKEVVEVPVLSADIHRLDMQDEIAELTTIAGRAVAALLAGAPRFLSRHEPAGAMAYSRESPPDLNLALILPTGDGPRLLAEAASLAREAGHGAAVFLLGAAAEMLSSGTARLGLPRVATMTLMALEPVAAIQTPRPCHVLRAETPALRAASGDIVAAAFHLPRPAVAAALDSAPGGPGVAELFLGAINDRIETAASVVRAGATAGIWCVGTLPAAERRGHASALLAALMERYRTEGVTRFYLYATAAGRPVYERLGFRALTDVAIHLVAAPDRS